MSSLCMTSVVLLRYLSRGKIKLGGHVPVVFYDCVYATHISTQCTGPNKIYFSAFFLTVILEFIVYILK